jgi:hypothetical protein
VYLGVWSGVGRLVFVLIFDTCMHACMAGYVCLAVVRRIIILARTARGWSPCPAPGP